MSRKYYKRNSDGKEFTGYGEISNGHILTHFDPKLGHPISNGSFQLFVTKMELKTEFTPFEFKLETSLEIDAIIAKNLSDFIYQFENYGISETQAMAFSEFYQSASCKLNVYKEMIKQGKDAEFKHFLLNDDDEFEFGEAEDLFNMLCGGMIPIIKKMMIELLEKEKQ